MSKKNKSKAVDSSEVVQIEEETAKTEAVEIEEEMVEPVKAVEVSPIAEPECCDVLDVAKRHPNFLPSWEASIRSFVASHSLFGNHPEATWIKVLAVWGIKV